MKTEKRDENLDRDEDSNKFIGDIIGGMIAFDQDISNRLMADGWGAAEEWATAYHELVESIYKVNNDLKVDRVLGWSRWDALERADHYREMREKFEN